MTGAELNTSQEKTSGPNELIMQYNNTNWNNPGSFRSSYSSAYNNSNVAANSLPENFDFDMFIQFTRSPTAEKRESAAKATSMVLDRLIDSSEADRTHYIEALEELLSDFEDVQTMTLDKIYTIFNTTQKTYPELWDQLNQRIPRLVIKAMRFSSQTQNSAINAITKLIEENLLALNVIQTVIVPSLFDFVADFKAFQSDDPGAYETWFANRVQIASILCKIANSADVYPRKWVYHEFLPKYSLLFTDKNCVIRKLAISSIGTFAKLFGPDFTEKGLVPHLTVAIDDENYRVRKLCSDVFVEVAKNCSSQVRSEILTPKFLQLMNDSSKNVYFSAMQQLGPFIATFADPKKTGVAIRDGRVIRVRTISGSSRKSSESSVSNLNTSTISLSSITTSPSPTAMTELDDEFSVLPKGFRLPGEELLPNETILHPTIELNSSGEVILDSYDEPLDEPESEVENEFNKSFANVDASVEGTDEHLNDYQITENQLFSEENANPDLLEEPIEYPPSMVFELTDENLKIHDKNFVEYIQEINAPKEEISVEQLKVVILEEKVEGTVCESEKIRENKKTSVLSPNTSAISNRYWSFESSNFDLENELEAYARSSSTKTQVQTTISTTSASNGVVIPKLNLELDISDPNPTSPEKSEDTPKNIIHMDSSFWQRRFDLLKDSVQELVRKKKPKSLSPEPNSPVSEQGQKTPVRRTSLQGTSGSVGNTPKHLATVSEDEEEKEINTPYSMMSSTFTQSISTSFSFIRAKARLPPLVQLRDTQKTSPPPPTPPPKFGTSEWNWNDSLEIRKRTSSTNSLGLYGHIISSTLTEEEVQYIRKNKQDIIPHALLDCLLCIDVSYDIEQQEVVQNLARNFPAIAFTLGQRNWVYLKGFYQKMANHFMLPVRATLARSMHEIAQIIGSELTDKDLVSIFETFLKDDYEVQLGLLKHLYDFYKMVSPSIREHLATQLGAFIGVEGSRNWRLRHDLAEQCIKLCRLYTSGQINDYISCYAMTFANDTFAEVRKKGVELLAEVLTIFIRDEWSPDKPRMPLTEALLNDARRSFFKTTSWRRRQSWGHVLETILKKNLLTIDQFFEFFANDLLALSKDNIGQVRLTFCHVMRNLNVNVEKCKDLREMLQILELNEDDMEIQLQAKFALGRVNPSNVEMDMFNYGNMIKRREEKMMYDIHEYQRAQFGVDFEKKGFKDASPVNERKFETSPTQTRNQVILSFPARTYVSLAEPEPDILDYDSLEEENMYKNVPSTSQNQKNVESTIKLKEQNDLNEAMKKLLAEHNMSEEEFVEFFRNYGGKSGLHEPESGNSLRQQMHEAIQNTNLVEKIKENTEKSSNIGKSIDVEAEKSLEIEEEPEEIEIKSAPENSEDSQKEAHVSVENVHIKVHQDNLVTDEQVVPVLMQEEKSPPRIDETTTNKPIENKSQNEKSTDLGSEV